jgi:hypothetical protein
MSDAAAEKAEFAAVLAEIADEPAEAEAPEPAETEAEAPEEPEPTDAAPAPAKLLEAGDIEAAAKRLGIDPKIFGVDKRQFIAMRKGLSESKRLAADGAKAKAEADSLRAQAEQVYGPIAAGFRAMRAGDGAKLRAAIELLAEDSFDNVVAVIQRANKPIDPATAEVMRLRAEIAERDRALKAEQAKAQSVDREKADLAKLETRLAATPLAKVPNAARDIYALVKSSWDGTGYTLTAQQAYGQVKAKAEAIAKALAAKSAPAAPTRKPLTKRELTTRPTLTPEEREKADFQRVLQETETAMRATERAKRRAR